MKKQLNAAHAKQRAAGEKSGISGQKEKEKKMLKKNHLNKIIGIISAMMLVLGTLSVPVFATDAAEYDAPVVTVASESDVNTISSAEELLALQQTVAALGNGQYLTGTYTLTDDIDMSTVASEWTGIGVPQSSKGFAGTFNGDGHTISGISINNAAKVGPKGGLFNLVSQATIKNLKVEGTVTSTRFVGGLIGRVINGATISDCVVNMELTLNNGQSNSVGGLIGQCGAGSGAGTGDGSGGPGTTSGSLTITNCAVLGNFSSNTANNPVGGMFGHIYSNYNVYVNNSYVAADLSASAGTGSLIGNNAGNVTFNNVYYLNGMASSVVSTGTAVSAGATSFNAGSLTASELDSSSWTDESGINVFEGYSYPVLMWQSAE